MSLENTSLNSQVLIKPRESEGKDRYDCPISHHIVRPISQKIYSLTTSALLRKNGTGSVLGLQNAVNFQWWITDSPVLQFSMSRPTTGTLTVQNTPRSSITIIDRTRSALEDEILKEQERIKAYGGDDVHDPEKYAQQASSSSQSKPETKEDFVTWDGPNDPANPQNWSNTKKWLITILCAAITVNVYVLAHTSFLSPSWLLRFAVHLHPLHLVQRPYELFNVLRSHTKYRI